MKITGNGPEVDPFEVDFTDAEKRWFRGEEMYEAIPVAIEDEKPTGRLKSKQAAADPKLGQPQKPSVQFVPPAAIYEISTALAEGRMKYGTAKWRECETEVMTYIGGALRHLYAYVDGEDIDPESLTGKSHLAGALASLAILVDVIAMGTAIDNRPPPGPGCQLMRRVTK